MEQLPERVFEVHWLGRLAYDQAWQLQDRLAAEIAAGQRRPALLLLEHPPVYTIGRRGKVWNVLWTETQLVERGIAVHQVDRGGDVTYHGPGQLVGYPLLPLAPLRWQGEQGSMRLPQQDYVGYLRDLEKVLIFALASLGLVAGQREGLTGVWVAADVLSRCVHCDPSLKPEPGKIASIGVKIDVNGISRHGFALNVATDPLFWEGIVPCGLDRVQMVNLADLLDPAPSMQQAIEAVIGSFEEVFHCRLVQSKNL